MRDKAPKPVPPHPAERNDRSSARLKMRLLIPLVLIAASVLLTAAVLKRTTSTVTVSEVKRSFRQLALRQGDSREPRQGGEIGPWWIAADGCDDLLSGEFINFRLDSGNLHVAARRASLQVDPVADTVRIEMWGVVYTRAPYTRRNEKSQDHFLHEMDHFVLGPASLGIDIVPDAEGAIGRTSPLPMADATTEPE